MNARSLDGCAGLKVARKQRGEYLLFEDVFIHLRRILKQQEALMLGMVLGALLMYMLMYLEPRRLVQGYRVM